MPEPIPLPCPRERATELAAVRSWLARNPVVVESCDVAPCEPVGGGAALSRVLRMIRSAERLRSRRRPHARPEHRRRLENVASAVELLAEQMGESYAILVAGLGELTDDEFFWEPGPDCWRVYRDVDGRWTYDYQEPDPVPAPLTTIGWRLVHIALCKVMYHEYAFGPRRLTWHSSETPHTADDATAMLGRGHELLANDLSKLSDAELERAVLTNWGEGGQPGRSSGP